MEISRVVLVNATAAMVLAAADIQDAVRVLRAVGTPEAERMADQLAQRRVDLLTDRNALRLEYVKAMA